MSKRTEQSKAGTIARLIRCAFVQANQGEGDKALALWQQAINRGYAPDPKTERGLILAIKKGRRDRGLDPGSTPPSGIPPSALDGDIR